MKFEIWLGDHYSHFERGLLHLEDGTTKELKGWIHSSTWGTDSLLIADMDLVHCPDFPVRWYIHENDLGFYCWDDGIEAIILHNDTQKHMDVSRFGLLHAGETWELSRDGFW